MLEFFRRYQRAFFMVVTVAIVISFSFFGTFQTFSGKENEDKVVFTAVDGSKVLHSEVNDMVNFLSTDLHDLLFSGMPWSGNSLNDGVVSTDIMESGLAQIIAAPYFSSLSKEYGRRLDREKRYTPYVHPKASFLTAEQIWAYYAPDVKTQFDLLRSHDQGDEKAFASRVQLYVAERHFPPVYLKQLLRRQESAHKWLPQDTLLAQRDLALFGYHNVQDWFGRDFLELVAQFIINASKMAEQKGYSVTQEEALGSLFRNAEIAFKEQHGKLYLGVASPGEFFQEQLRKLGMDQSRALKTWTTILLFRQLFSSSAEAILVEPSPYKNFYQHLSEFVDIDLYQLPEEFRFTSMSDVQKFALYLKAVRVIQDPARESGELYLPKQFLPAKEVKKVYPELVQRKFKIRWASLNKDQLQTRIGVKGTWDWQVADANWKLLKERFPELQKGASNTAEERLDLLDKVNPVNRAAIDAFSRSAIVDAHPEWIEEALTDMPVSEEEVYLREQGGKLPFDGISQAAELIALFDTVPTGEQSDKLRSYTQDKVFYHRMTVIDNASQEEILSFGDAMDDGTMTLILDKVLESAYVRVRAKDPARFLKENGEWKPLHEVKDRVENHYFEPLNHYLDKQIVMAKEKKETKNYTLQMKETEKAQSRVAVALLPHVAQVLTTLQTAPDQVASLTTADPEDEPELDTQQQGPGQWKLVKSQKRLVRMDQDFPVDPQLAFSLDRETNSSVISYQESGPCFFTVVEKGFIPASASLNEKTLSEKELLGKEAMCDLAQNLLSEMQQKGAASVGSQKSGPQENTTTASPAETAGSEA